METESDAPNASPEAPAEQAEKAETKEAPAEKKPLLARLRPLLPHLPALLLVLVVSVCFGLSFGLNYGVDNQTVYMLGSLRLLDPSVLARDWYTTQSANYHPAFAYLGWLLLALDRGGRFVGYGLVVVASLGAASLYWLAAELLPRRQAVATFLLVMAIAFVTRMRSVAVSYAFDFILQPSALGSLFLLAALAPFVSGRWLVSGVFLGLSGLFHANYLILGIGTFGLVHLLLGWKDLPKRLLQQLGPPLVAFLLLSPLFFHSFGSKENAVLAQDILFNIRAPHHYSPKNWRGGFYPVAAWQMLGLGAGAWLLRGLDGRGRRLGALVVAMSAVIWGGTMLTTWVFIPRVAQLFVWRYAPFLDLLMVLLLCTASVRIAVQPGLFRRVGPAGLALVLGGLVTLTMLDGPAKENGGVPRAVLLAVAPAAVGLLGAGAGALLARRRVKIEVVRAFLSRHGAWAVVAYAAFACWHMGSAQVQNYRARSNIFTGFSGPEADLYGWIKGHTPKDAIFLTPPQIDRFRLNAERAIVVDWKASAITPDDLVEWYRRLEDISGRKNFRKGEDVTEGYADLTPARLEALKAKYHVDYAVVARGRENGLPGKVVYQNGRFVVLALGG